MHTKSLITLTLFAIASGAALADDITMVPAQPPSTLERAEVRAEVLQASEWNRLLPAGEFIGVQRAPASADHAKPMAMAPTAFRPLPAGEVVNYPLRMAARTSTR